MIPNNFSVKIDSPEQKGTSPRIEGRYTEAQKIKLAKASRDFESVLTTFLVKSMTKTNQGMFGEEESGGFGNDTFAPLFEQNIASKISEGKGFGLAQKIYKKMTGEDLPGISIVNSSKLLNNKLKNQNNIEIQPIEDFNKIPATRNNVNIKSITPSDNSLKRLEKYDTYIKEAAEKFNVNENIIRSVILAESAGNEKALSKVKAKGLMQLMDGTAKDMGVKNVWNPRENILGGTKYLSRLIRQYDGDINMAIAAYNAGPGNVNKYNGIPPFKETKNYVNRVLAYVEHFNDERNFA